MSGGRREAVDLARDRVVAASILSVLRTRIRRDQGPAEVDCPGRTCRPHAASAMSPMHRPLAADADAWSLDAGNPDVSSSRRRSSRGVRGPVGFVISEKAGRLRSVPGEAKATSPVIALSGADADVQEAHRHLRDGSDRCGYPLPLILCRHTILFRTTIFCRRRSTASPFEAAPENAAFRVLTIKGMASSAAVPA